MRTLVIFGVAILILSVRSPFSHAGTSLRIMPLGDSITYGSNYAGAYRIQLEKLLAQEGITAEFVGSQKNGPPELRSQANEGHGGWTIDNIQTQIEKWLKDSHPDVVLLMIGTNDIWHSSNSARDVPAMIERLKKLILKIHKDLPKARLIVGSVPFTVMDWNPYVVDFNKRLSVLLAAESSRAGRTEFADIYAVLKPEDLEDGVHPTQQGYEKIAQVWFEALKPATGKK